MTLLQEILLDIAFGLIIAGAAIIQYAEDSDDGGLR